MKAAEEEQTAHCLFRLENALSSSYSVDLFAGRQLEEEMRHIAKTKTARLAAAQQLSAATAQIQQVLRSSLAYSRLMHRDASSLTRCISLVREMKSVFLRQKLNGCF